MGEIADQIIEGQICQECCCAMKDEAGYPVTCNECDPKNGLPLWESDDEE